MAAFLFPKPENFAGHSPGFGDGLFNSGDVVDPGGLGGRWS